MGLTPAHYPMQKKQKGAGVTDIWTNDSPIAISRRHWVPPRPAVLNGEGRPHAAGMALYGFEAVLNTSSPLRYRCRRLFLSLSLCCDGTAGISCRVNAGHRCLHFCANKTRALFDYICGQLPTLCVPGEFQVVADGVPKSPNGSGNTCDDKVKGAFPHLQGDSICLLLLLSLLRVRWVAIYALGWFWPYCPQGVLQELDARSLRDVALGIPQECHEVSKQYTEVRAHI